MSPTGGSALIVYVPDAPLALADVPAITDATKVGLTWTNGVSDGGTDIIDYTIQQDQSTGVWKNLVSGVKTTPYTTTETLIPGKDYQFRVQARNSVGLSLTSAPVTILVAQAPA